ncbi:NADH-quinone oxidoreductase subunit NuoG [uncultured Microbulbifer sp.]|uniref:NADH-quinone oxidoreductase subunit NuoG n=1 Tax=uncultured Microbulbifer sp. TaxID=348147 RepID=UPI0025FB75D2|nr:NADH-quinone oxidoreductase subunit NuoG [uncultured Microbulbifer sp.]
MAKVTITIDDREYEVDEGQNLLHACLGLKKNLPYFCWHPAMGSVGACRQCAVIEYMARDDTRGRLIISCMTPVRDGGVYSLEDERAQSFRAGIIEKMMVNHPHDCPVCEEGGECHLQDMTLMSAHTMRRYSGRKRTFNNQNLGPFINHEMNRCITCYRCVRYYQDYAGGRDLQALGRNQQVYFGRAEDGRLENGFSGNLVEVCPTGVFTDKTFSRRFVRKWDLQTAPSVCEHCGVGCNTAPGARDDGKGDPRKLRRVVNLYHRDINGYFLCDRGRFGYEYANSPERILQPLQADTQPLIQSTAAAGEKIHRPLPPQDAVAQLADIIEEARLGKRRLLGIGSTRTSLENNYALKTLVGPANFYAGVSAGTLQLLHLVNAIQQDPQIHSPSTPEIEQADAVLILGEDISNTAPRIALAVRQAAAEQQRQRARALDIPLWQDASVRQLDSPPTPIFIAAVEGTDLDGIARETVYATPDEIAELALEVVNQLPGAVTESQTEASDSLATQIARALASARKPLIVCGCGLQSPALLRAAAALAKALAANPVNSEGTASCALYLACADANSLGLTQLCSEQQHLEQLLSETAQENSLPSTLLAMEVDLFWQLPDEQAARILHGNQLIQLDSLYNHTSRFAQLLLPSAATPESEGTFVNSSGLAQRYYTVYEPSGYIQESWRWLANATAACAARAGGVEKIPALADMAQWQHVTQVSAAMAAGIPQLSPLSELGPDWNTLVAGAPVARQSHRFSGRTALQAEVAVAEQPPPRDPDAPMAFSMEGIQFAGYSPLQANIWAPGWNSDQAIHKFQNQPGGERAPAASGQSLRRATKVFEIQVTDTGVPKTPVNADLLTTLPLYRLFGSGELSRRARSIATVVGQAFVHLHPDDARALALCAGEQVCLPGSDTTFEVKITAVAPQRCIGISAGYSSPQAVVAMSPQDIRPFVENPQGNSS